MPAIPYKHGLYPWGRMNVGDWFVYPGTEHAAYMLAKAHTERPNSYVFKVFPVEGEVRIWRLA